MAQKPLRPCRHPGCAELTRNGWCDRHKPKPVRKRSAEYHDWYLLPIWQDRLRPNQLMREPFCRACAAKGIRTLATVADHIKPHRGDWSVFTDETNLQSLCERCHNRKTMQEQRELAQENRR